MARQSTWGSKQSIWLALFLSLSAGIAVSTWQSEVITRRERNWALKTPGGVEAVAEISTERPAALAERRQRELVAGNEVLAPQPEHFEEQVVVQEPEIDLRVIEEPAADEDEVAGELAINDVANDAANERGVGEALNEALGEAIPAEEVREEAVADADHRDAEEEAPLIVETQPLLPPIAGPAQQPVEMEEEPAAPEQVAESSTRPSTREAAPEIAQEQIPEHAKTPVVEERPVIEEPRVRVAEMVRPKTPTNSLKGRNLTPVPAAFAMPMTLSSDLDRLSDAGPFARFAVAASREVEVLTSHRDFHSAGAQSSIKRLEMLRKTGLELAAENATDPNLTTHLRAVHGLSRRLPVWRALMEVPADSSPEPLSTKALVEAAKLVQSELRKSGNPAAPAWEKFLLLSEWTSPKRAEVVGVAELALIEKLRKRTTSESLTDEQIAFLQNGPPRDLLAAVEFYETPPLSQRELLELLESYEAEPTTEQARRIAIAIAQASLSSDEKYTALATTLNQFYRGANVRVAISEKLINELLPTPPETQEPVYDQVLGARVMGRSNVSTRLRVQLVPDSTRWCVGLEATGDVASNTQAFHGPFTFFNQGWANYRARTTVGLGKRGFDLNPATAEASSQTDLLDLQSDFDGIPIFGLIARGLARQQHASQQVEAEWEVEGRMARRIEERLTNELSARMQQAEKEWTTRVAQPLEELRLAPTPVALETTSERLIARYRVAGDSQLAAYTPRPLAPSDSVLSVQIHVSSINNFIEQLQLAGKTYKLEELYLHLNRAMGLTDQTIPEDMPEGIYVQFAEEDPLRMDIRDGQAELTVRLAEIRQGRTKWKNVQVRGRFTPKVDGLNAELERTSYVELKGDGLKKIGGGQVVLRVAFSSVLSRVSHVPLIHPKLASHPKMQQYVVRQFDCEDGWIGLAIGPRLATADAPVREERTETARRPRGPMMENLLRR